MATHKSCHNRKGGINMWYVYNRQDSWQCGWVVKSEEEALKQCIENDELTCKYVDESY